MTTAMKRALDRAEPRPSDTGSQSDKKNYAERLSRHLATEFANALRPSFDGITPTADGGEQESRARSSKGVKKLDVNYSTPELGLGLGVSVKTLNFKDGASARYTKNFTRIDNELRAEAIDYHERQPYAVLVAVVFLPMEAALDGSDTSPSSFGKSVQVFRPRAGREEPRSDPQLFEKVYVGLYEYDGKMRGNVRFFDVLDAPPRRGVPDRAVSLDFEGLVAAIERVYDQRNKPPFVWADGSTT